ncbi:MAG: glycosyltransferase, partial [Acidobacteria bacterium]|nr:glycosyltransferase [Acidobacteriota bacterium]
KFIVGSEYLKALVLDINKNIDEGDICIIPTCVDYEAYSQKDYSGINAHPIINLGWIGSNGNLALLENIIPYIDEVNKVTPVKLIVISGREIDPDVGFEIENLEWSYETQIDDLLKIDIGLMPLNDTRVERGKCGFKLIQYMGLGIVGVASSITINKEIVSDRVEGFLVDSDEDWTQVLLKVIELRDQFQEIGDAARRKINERYSFKANTQKYLTFIETHFA